MRYVTDLQVEQVIVHKVFRNDFVLSERPLPVDGHEGLVQYLTGHIESALHDPSAKAARFAALDDSLTSGLCQGLLANAYNLVEGSRKLAERLHEIVVRDARIADGAMAVCPYFATNHLGRIRYLAILKLDPMEAYHPVTARDAEGRLYVGFESQGGLLPPTGQKLHKCAFVRPMDPRPEYDMMLLDRQVAPGAPSPVAKFFVESFLGASMALDNRQRTERLYRALVSAHNKLRLTLGPQENEALDRATYSAITSSYVNIDSLIEALPLPDMVRNQIADVMAQALPDAEFEIDASYAQRLVRKRKFEGEQGLRLEVSAEGYRQVVRSVEPIEEPGERPYYRIVIHTEKWREMPR